MSSTLHKLIVLVSRGEVRISDHGYDELAADRVSVRDLVAGLPTAELLEDYPEFYKGPCVLVLQWDRDGKPVHAVWGIPSGESSPAVLVTAYRPEPERWSQDFRRRKT
ncbi:MAG: DUF4258 domain-containing protein [Lentisphaerae bacterium]|nr:DUF4258 domain-containing protein [Lentisphaerota bacterium]